MQPATNEHETSVAGGTPDDLHEEATQQIDAGFDLVAARERARDGHPGRAATLALWQKLA
jgi:hypothetical protein